MLISEIEKSGELFHAEMIRATSSLLFPFNVMFPQYKGDGETLKFKRLEQTPIGH